jgi:hypothetical protein
MSVPWVHIRATQTLIVSTLLVPIPVSVEVVMLEMESLVKVCDFINVYIARMLLADFKNGNYIDLIFGGSEFVYWTN